MKCKRIAALLLAVCTAYSVTGCGISNASTGSDNEYQKIELTMAVNGTDTQIDARVADHFAELVEERTGGNVTIAVFPNDQLAGGNASKGIEMIAQGSVDLAAYATCTMAVIDQQLPVATIPWSFKDYDEASKVIDSTGGKYYAERLEAKGMTYLGSFHNGFRQITNSKREITKPEDLKNLKIRVPGSDIYMGFFRKLGADASSMSWSEVFTAIQQGTLDGQENGISVTSTSKMAEVQKYMTRWNYSYENDLFVASSLIWDTLEPKTREVIQECAKESCQWGRDTLVAEEEDLVKEFEEQGMKVTELTDEQLAVFQDAIADWKAEKIRQFGDKACGAFGITE